MKASEHRWKAGVESLGDIIPPVGVFIADSMQRLARRAAAVARRLQCANDLFV